ncbi:septum site-determining protein MinC [Clostridium vincentii]|uniref:Probable septum site-determining protein MinC n=1 Tax=Clostridium vincentii TaxID=52704 RepID=A0A2T0BEW2_9CLOT|nr:septum site-determining protein MinC [Clostridium vincentii]PRR82440.1 Septum site-determining protein MinC [Clostridium vincentii]
MEESGILIKGNKNGLNALVDIDKFSGFDEMLRFLTEKLSKGKKFYKDSTLYINIDIASITEKDMSNLKDILLKEIGVKEIIIEEKEINEKDNNFFSGIYEGKTKFIRKTVRGGQSVNFPGNIVIIGDVNSGAEVYAGGNIIVLGSVKGNVFAGTTGNDKAIIASFLLQPEILKIGDIITISPDDGETPRYPEVASIKDNAIIVEPYLTNKYTY